MRPRSERRSRDERGTPNPARTEAAASPPTAREQPSPSYSFTMRLHTPQRGGAFARAAAAIEDTEATLGAIDLVRDVTVACIDGHHADSVARAVRTRRGPCRQRL